MKVSNANTDQLDGKDLKILNIIHSSENPRLRLGFSKLFMISRILKSFPPMVQYCINNLTRSINYIDTQHLGIVLIAVVLSTYIPRGLTARIAGFHPAGPGSTPGVGNITFTHFLAQCQYID